MIQVKQCHSGKPDTTEGPLSWFELQLIHPLTEEVVLDADGFETLDEVAVFLADIGSAIQSALLEPSDIKEQIRVVE